MLDQAPLPAPLVSAEVDLRDFAFMPLEVVRLRRSKAWLISKRKPEIGFFMMNLWCSAWHEVPAASLEDDDDVLSDYAMCPPERWADVRRDVLRGWVKCSDGRLYHPVVAEKALEAWKHKLERFQRTRNANEERERRRKARDVERNIQRDVGSDVERDIGGNVERDNQRHNDRDADATSHVAAPHVLQGRGTGTGNKKERKTTPKYLAPDSLPREPVAIPGSGSEEVAPLKVEADTEPPPAEQPPKPSPEALRRRELIQAYDAEIVAIYGDAKARGWPHGTDSVTAGRWVESGIDAELARGVYHASLSKAKAQGREPPNNLRYFDQAMADALALRQAPPTQPRVNGHTPPPASASLDDLAAQYPHLPRHRTYDENNIPLPYLGETAEENLERLRIGEYFLRGIWRGYIGHEPKNVVPGGGRKNKVPPKQPESDDGQQWPN